MMNTTPVDAVKMLGGKTPGEVGLEKPRFKAIPAAKVDKVFDPKYLVQEKVDGASLLYHLLADHIEALSYRVSKGGRPIVHTYRVFGPSGSQIWPHTSHCQADTVMMLMCAMYTIMCAMYTMEDI